MSDALPLPPRPNLEQYKKLARDFQDACKSGAPAAICGTNDHGASARLPAGSAGLKSRAGSPETHCLTDA